jgi:hypothetical protein
LNTFWENQVISEMYSETDNTQENSADSLRTTCGRNGKVTNRAWGQTGAIFLEE